MKKFWPSRLRLERETWLALLAFGVNAFLVFNVFLPSLRDLNFWDEAVYINTGRLLAEGQLPSFARNPLIGVLYGLAYLPFRSAPLWMGQAAAIGRVVLFALMWWGCYLAAREFSRFAPALATAGCLLVFPVLPEALVNPSDALFAAMSGLAFWQTARFYHTQDTRNLWGASFFVGLAALSRNDGLLLFPIFILLAFGISRRPLQRQALPGEARRYGLGGLKFSWVMPAALPFALLVGGYFLLYGAVTGDFSLGTRERSYVAFQQGQAIDYQKDPSCTEKWLRCTVLQAEQLYGSGEENNYSILRAIRRNPQAFGHRVLKQVSLLPGHIYSIYGERTALLLFILALRGLLELLRKRQGLLAASFLLWPLTLLVYFLTFFRVGYFRLPYFVLYILGAIGAAAFAADTQNRRSLYVWSALLAAATLPAMLLDVRAVYFTTVLLLAGLWFIRLLPERETGEVNWNAASLLVILAIGLILRPVFDPPAPHDLVNGAEEQAAVVMQEALPRGSLVMAGAPGGVWAGRMEFHDANAYSSLTSSEELYEALKEAGVTAIFVDPYLSNANEHVWNLVEPGIGTWYESVYSGREGSIRVLLMKP